MSLHIEVHGSGAVPLVMIHGWAMHGGVFAPLVKQLEDRCTMYVVDLPGHGHSRESTLPLDPAACAQVIASATPAAFWLGWSLGGLTALQATQTVPQHVLGLAMLSTTPKFVRSDDWTYGNDPALVRQLALDLETDYHATLERFLALEAMGSTDPRSELRTLRADVFSRGEPDLRVLQEGLRILEQTDLRDTLPTLPVRSSWVAGHLDRLVHPDAMRWSAAQCGGEIAVVPHAGHAPFLTHADAVAQALHPLLESAA